MRLAKSRGERSPTDLAKRREFIHLGCRVGTGHAVEPDDFLISNVSFFGDRVREGDGGPYQVRPGCRLALGWAVALALSGSAEEMSSTDTRRCRGMQSSAVAKVGMKSSDDVSHHLPQTLGGLTQGTGSSGVASPSCAPAPPFG